MEKNTAVRKPHTSTADLLTWPEKSPADSPSIGAGTPGSRPTIRTHQPAGGISSVLFGGQMTEEEAENSLKRKPCSNSKWREMTGSGIFTDDENGVTESGSVTSTTSNKTGLRIYQQAVSGISQISFSADEGVSPKKPTSIAEVAKQRELSGTLESESDAKMKKQLSDLKSKELSGHDIFGPPPEVPHRPLAARTLELKENKDVEEPAPRNPAGGQSNIMFSEETPVKSAKKIYNQKVAELSGNDIFKGDAPPGSAEKPLSVAKLREMSGNDIFADEKAASRDYFGGVRKPPGGESSIALV
ncbi:uncharacterized protein LOC143857857 isoform X2 [Tasmannia lanceolata]|uniref:uncharacterized protein LOC143857857 isoform X2 n=1 Tax=Tasmannia lanceolata TaxID=3420 RepID=UPI0040644D1F